MFLILGSLAKQTKKFEVINELLPQVLSYICRVQVICYAYICKVKVKVTL
jgi:hypothetical protein